MRYVNFDPWVGEYYDSQVIKIMHLGKQFCIWDEILEKYKDKAQEIEHSREWCELTNVLINSHIYWEVRNSTFTKAMGMISDEKSDIEAWNKIIFYNFLQGLEIENVLLETIEHSQKAFYEVLKKYKPDLVIVWGSELHYKWLPSDENDWVDEEYGKENQIWKYKKYPNTLFWSIYHPSSPKFNAKYFIYRQLFNEIIQKYL